MRDMSAGFLIAMRSTRSTAVTSDSPPSPDWCTAAA